MIDPTLLNLLPPLRRARGDRLYGPDGKYWVDLWKQDGVWLLGRRPDGAAKEWKNQIDKGLGGWAPSLWPRRLEPLVRRLLPATIVVRVFRNVDRAPAAPVWRPWEELTDPVEGWAVRRLILPTGAGQAVALAFTDKWTAAIPEPDVTSPAEAAGLVHAAAQVLRFTDDAQAVQTRGEACQAFDSHFGSLGVFIRQGLWFEVHPSHAAGYSSLFRAHLAAGFLLNPDEEAPGLIPVALSNGEWKAWKAIVEAWIAGRP